MALLCLAGWAQPANEQLQQGRRDLKQVRQRLQKAQRVLTGQKKTEQRLLSQLGWLDRRLAAARLDLRTHERNLKLVEERLLLLRAQDRSLESKLAVQRQLLRLKLRVLHRLGPLRAAALLGSARSPAEFFLRLRLLARLGDFRARQVAEISIQMKRLEEFRVEYMAKQAELKRHRMQASAARVRVGAERRSREQMLSALRRKKASSLEMVRELSQAAEKLSKLVSQLQAEARLRPARQEISLGPTRLVRQGSLPWPVRGRVVGSFGEQMHPRFRTRVFNRGIEIAAPFGEPIKAVAPGVVRFAGPFEGYGNMAVLDHGGGYFTVYGYAAELAVASGEEVEGSQEIGQVGDAGTLGQSTLYFEIRARARAVNPLEWLGH